jgi:hypothetical protein
MSYKVDGVEPTIIDVVYEKTGEKTELNSLNAKYLETSAVGVWGKPYTLHYETNSTYTISVTRIESKYQGASLGALSSGSVIYYGDVLTIIIARVSGYYISSTTFNGETETHSNTISIERNWDVDGSLTISATTIAIASWHSLFSGSDEVSFLGSESTKTFSEVPTIPSGTTKIRVNAQYKSNFVSKKDLVTNYEISVSNGSGTSSNLGTSDNGFTTLYILVSGSKLQAKGKPKNAMMPVSVYMTKVEAYY